MPKTNLFEAYTPTSFEYNFYQKRKNLEFQNAQGIGTKMSNKSFRWFDETCLGSCRDSRAKDLQLPL